MLQERNIEECYANIFRCLNSINGRCIDVCAIVTASMGGVKVPALVKIKKCGCGHAISNILTHIIGRRFIF